MNMTKDYNPKEYRRNDSKKGLKAIALLLTLIAVLIFNTGTASAAVDGITENNYMDYVKPIPDEYGFPSQRI